MHTKITPTYIQGLILCIEYNNIFANYKERADEY